MVPIIVQDLPISAQLTSERDGLAICFADPSFIRSEGVLVDRASRMVGVLFEQGFHKVGLLPAGIALEGLSIAHLSAEAHSLHLSAPIKVS